MPKIVLCIIAYSAHTGLSLTVMLQPMGPNGIMRLGVYLASVRKALKANRLSSSESSLNIHPVASESNLSTLLVSTNPIPEVQSRTLNEPSTSTNMSTDQQSTTTKSNLLSLPGG